VSERTAVRWRALSPSGALLAAPVLTAALLIALVLPAVPPTAAEPPEHVFADAFVTWIYPRPEIDAQPIGYYRAGSRAKRTAAAPVRGAGCPGRFVAVEPAGYVCLGPHASLTQTRYAASLASLAPSPGPFPFAYALSMGSPAYRRLPTSNEVRRREAKFGPAGARALPPHWRGHEELVGGQHASASPLPGFLQEGGSASRLPEDRLLRREIPFGSMVAVTSAFSHEGRAYLQSADGTILPAERFLPFRRSDFAGVELGEAVGLPLAWARRELTVYDDTCLDEAPPLATDGRLGPIGAAPAACLTASAERVSLRTALALSGRQQKRGRTTFVETQDGRWLQKDQLFVAERPDESVSTRDKWIHFSIGRGTLIAFEGERPVFATLASPGIGGRPRQGGNALVDRTTPLGTFRIQFKHRSDDMSPEQTEHRAFFIADVPHAMFFEAPFAIHVAYWHESFGEPMSAGCINVSPRDGARLFEWTDPPLPSGWHGVGAGAPFGPGTWVRVTSE
jgi:hypothetical protein